MPRLYEILGVEKEATQEQIKEGYKDKIKQLKLQKAELEPAEYEKRIKQLNEANEVLLHKGRRKEYDEIKPVTFDFGTLTNEILELQKYFEDHIKTLTGEGNIPAEKGYSSKLTGANEMQVTFRSQEEADSFIEKSSAKFPNASIVKADENGNKQYKTFAEIIKEKREKAVKEEKAQEKESKSELSESKSESILPRPSPMGGGMGGI